MSRSAGYNRAQYCCCVLYARRVGVNSHSFWNCMSSVMLYVVRASAVLHAACYMLHAACYKLHAQRSTH